MEDRDIVSLAVDLSRLGRDPSAELELSNLLSIGKEVDLLETLRSSEDVVDIGKVKIHAIVLGIDIQYLLNNILKKFEESKMINLSENQVNLLFSTPEDVYRYGKLHLSNSSIPEKEIKLSEFLLKCNKNPMPLTEFYAVLEYFEAAFREGVEKFLLNNNILRIFNHQDQDFIVSSRIFKDEKKFKDAMEILIDNKFGEVMEFIQDNPGNPMSVVQSYLNIDPKVLKVLTQCGILDPIRLNVKGKTNDYIYSPDILSQRPDNDHLDLVRKTLSNFRFGEYYSEKTKLKDLDRFFEYMLDHGYAGNAEAIGTDYKNLELAGIFRIEKVSNSNFRFWMLKKDVIKDARSVLKGIIPIRSTDPNININTIDSIVQSRAKLDFSFNQSDVDRITNAIRQIQEGTSS